MSTRPRNIAIRRPSVHPATRNVNHWYKYLRQLPLNDPFIFGWIDNIATVPNETILTLKILARKPELDDLSLQSM